MCVIVADTVNGIYELIQIGTMIITTCVQIKNQSSTINPQIIVLSVRNMKTYELFTGEELIIAEKIQRRRYQLLIHSCIYYYLNKNMISDMQWDKWAKELKILQEQCPTISEQVTLYEYFKDWDASTGAFLPITLDWVVSKARTLLKQQVSPTKIVKEKKTKKRSLF